MTITQSSTRFVALTLGVATVVAVAFSAAYAAPAQAALCPGTTWSRSLTVGSTGSDVMMLQQFLNMSADTQVSATGAGSPGSESSYFGAKTRTAVSKYQTKNGISPTAGYFGPLTRASVNSACAGGVSGGPSVPSGPGVSIAASTQPVNALAPSGATRVPFTNVTLSNNTGSAVTVTSITVQRTGVGVDQNLSGIVLLDNNGLQIGIAHTLNSNHQTNIGDNFTLMPGETKMLTIAGNIAASNVSQSGQIISLQVVAVNTTVPVNGTLPIVGASHTINTTLVLGSVSTSTSSYDPGTAQSKSIGDKDIRFTGVRFTASSAEDVKFYSIRWRQVGTASGADIGNIRTVVNGTVYATTLDSSGKYYTTVFPGGILIPKGNSVDVFVEGDITGTNAAGRTVDFDIDKNTDAYFVGQLYGYGVTFTPVFTNTPWLNGIATAAITGGSATSIQNATSIVSAKVPVNVPNTILGGFQTNFLGEPVTVTGMTISVATSSLATGGYLTGVSIVDSNGVVVAGPVDASVLGTSLAFTDSVTFPIGSQTYTVKGKVPSAWANNSTVTLSTTPSSQWTSATGQTTGNSVSLPSALVTMNQMTISGATSSVTASPNPVASAITPGTAVTLASIQLDAQQSGEDIRFNSVKMSETGTLSASALSACQLWDGTAALNSGSNTVNSVSQSGANTFTFDNSLVITKGTVKTLWLKCNISSGSTGTVIWGIDATYGYTGIGVQSGNSITAAATTGQSGTQTVGTSGTITLAVDSSAPSYKLVAAGTAGVTADIVRLRATTENVTLQKLGLQLTNSGNTKSNGAGGSTNGGVNDLVQVTIWDGSSQVGSITFTGTNTTATSTLSTPVTLTKDVDKLLTIKVDLAPISASASGGVGDVVKVDPLNAEGSGASSGQTVKTGVTGSLSAGLQMFKSYPTVANAGVSCTNSTTCNGTAQVLKKFTVSANSAGPVSLQQVAIRIATSSAQVTNAKLFAFTVDYDNSPANIPGTSNGQFGATATLGGTVDTAAPTLSFYQTTPYSFTGTTYFVLRGDVAPASGASNWSVTATVLGDTATTSSPAGYNATSTINRTGLPSGIATTTSGSNFIWAGNSSTTPTTNDIDWFNGYFVPGLSSTGF